MASRRPRLAAHRAVLRARLAVALGGAIGPAAAAASPGLEGTRNLSMGSSARASSFGTNAALASSATISFSQQFAIEPAYQYAVHDRTHGLGLYIVDSLINPRVAVALGYRFLRGAPQVLYVDPMPDADGNARKATLELSHFGHEASLFISVAAVKRWFAIGVKPKYQYTSLRYLDDEGKARDATGKLSAFGLDASLAFNGADWMRLSLVGYNLVGAKSPAWTDKRELSLEGVVMGEQEIDPDDPPFEDAPLAVNNVRRVSDYPRMLAHGLAVFPLQNPNFNLNFDAAYDFSSFWEDDRAVRYLLGGSAEFVAGPVPIRAGSYLDARGPGKADDRTYVTGGLGFVMSPKKGGAGVDIGVGFSQQVAGPRPGPRLETVLGANVGVRLHPDL